MKKMYILVLTSCFLFAATSCKTNKNTSGTEESEKVVVNVPTFSADSAYQYIQAQVDFGPRVPNTKQHVACGEFLANKLASFGAQVTNQYADVIAFDGTILKARNIIGSYKPESKKRLLLFAHWDTRPWSDNDPDPKNHHTPLLGANDGASGVGVLLEIARQIQKEAPVLGIDIIFFDAEDYGIPQFMDKTNMGNTNQYYCLGSQYWARNTHVEKYNARFGILLDMVGGRNATFYKEGDSEKYAKNVNTKVWKKARELGFGKFFIDQVNGYIMDDHIPVNQYARIPSIDIVPNFPDNKQSSFGSTWHTISDNMDDIDKNTLSAVGQTVMAVIYNEK